VLKDGRLIWQRDGNGRTGRLLIPLMLAAEGFPPLYVSGPLFRNRHDYFDALREVQLRSRWDGWIDFFTQAVMSACDESMALAAQLAALRDDWNRRVADPRADSASSKLVADLVSLGIRTDTARQRNRVFIAREAIAVLD
jgi:Fic family protein